jgi:hypothetical protein
LHYTGTTPNSNIIMGITSRKFEDGWMLTKSEKTKFLGTAGLIRAGGPCDDADKGVDRPSFVDDKVPACWHSLRCEFWEELIHSFAFEAVFVPTVMDDQPAMACIVSGTPGVLMLFSEEQRTLMRARLLSLIWEHFRDPSSKLYQVGVSNIIGTRTTVKARPPARLAHASKKTEDGETQEDKHKTEKRKALKALKKGKTDKVKKAKSSKKQKKGDEADVDGESVESSSDLDLSDG